MNAWTMTNTWWRLWQASIEFAKAAKHDSEARYWGWKAMHDQAQYVMSLAMENWK